MRKPSLAVAAVLLVSAIRTTSAFGVDEKTPPLAKAPFNAQQAREFQQQWSDRIGKPVVERIKGVEGAEPAIDPYQQRRKNPIDPGPQQVDISAAGKYAKELTIDLPDGTKMDFVLIPPGSFLMGSANGFGDETPVHRVVISRPFYMAKYEVTTAQWAAIMGKDGRFKFWESMKGEHDDATGPRKAMRDVSWDECQVFVAALQEKVAVSAGETTPPPVEPADYKFALPTEAQWEYACRAGSSTEFHFGDDASAMGEYAWFAGNMIWPGGGRTFPDGSPVRGVHYHDVGQKKPNAFELYDMHGGVWEWCADYYDKDYYVNSPLVDPSADTYCGYRSSAGGRDLAALLCRRSATATFRELSGRFGLSHPDSASDLIKRGRRLAESNREVARKVASIEKDLDLNPDSRA